MNKSAGMTSQQMMNEHLKKKFHGKSEIPSKYIPKYPDSAERDYVREMNQMFQKAVKPVLMEFLPELIQILRQAENNESRPYHESTRRMDASSRAKDNEEERAKARREALAVFAPLFEQWSGRLLRKLQQAVVLYNSTRKLNAIADATRKLTVKEWKKAIDKTLGINILEDYYDGDFYAEILEQWVRENVGLIKTIPQDMLDQMRKIILDGYLKGKPVSQIAKEIEKSYGVSKSHARLIARDQMGKLNCQITRHQQKACGGNKYTWRTVGDSRVRASHKKLDKHIFDWDHPPVVDEKTGRRCHPGEDYQCRCIAVQVFDLDRLDVPVNGVSAADTKKRR